MVFVLSYGPLKLLRQFMTLLLNDCISPLHLGLEGSSCLPASITQILHFHEHGAKLLDQIISTGFPFVHREAGEVVAAVLIGEFCEEREFVFCGGVEVLRGWGWLDGSSSWGGVIEWFGLEFGE